MKKRLTHKIEWVDIPAGKFIMGNNEGGFDDHPSHLVTITRPFKLSKYEITFEQYDEFCKSTNRTLPNDEGWGRGNRPVININWDDAVAFCEWAGVRLPTEAEWEYACRAGSTTNYYWGDEMNDDYCWHKKNSEWKSHPVGEKNPNAWGLYDMLGNVWEWCTDGYREYTSDPQIDPIGAIISEEKILRGGGWNVFAFSCTSAHRTIFKHFVTDNYLGFRVAKDIEKTPHEIYKQGDAVPSGVYVAYMKEGIKYASKDYSGEGIFGALVSDGNHKMIVSPKNIESKKSWQFPADLLIDGVYTTDEDKDWDEQLEDAKTEFNGKSNTNIIIEWKNTDHRNLADASVESVLFEYNGVSNWYLPSVGEFQYVMDNLEEVNKVLAKIEGYEELESQMTYWLSTQYSFLFAWIWDAFNGLTVSEKYNDYWVRPFCSFDVD